MGQQGEGEEAGEQEQAGEEETTQEVDWQGISGGVVNSQEEFNNLLVEVQALRAKANDNPFKDENSKNLYNMLSKYDGNAEDNFISLLQLNKLDLAEMAKTDPKSLLWESFKRDEKYAGIPADKLRPIFERNYNSNYVATPDETTGEVNAEDQEILDTQRMIEVNAAVKTLEKLQNEFRDTAVQEPSPDQRATELYEISKSLDETFKELNEYPLTVDIGTPESPNEIAISSPISSKQHQEIKQFMLNLSEGWNKLLTNYGAIDDQGNINYTNYAKFAHSLLHGNEIRKSAINQARTEWEIIAREKASNLGQDSTRQSPPAEGGEVDEITEGLKQSALKKYGKLS